MSSNLNTPTCNTQRSSLPTSPETPIFLKSLLTNPRQFTVADMLVPEVSQVQTQHPPAAVFDSWAAPQYTDPPQRHYQHNVPLPRLPPSPVPTPALEQQTYYVLQPAVTGPPAPVVLEPLAPGVLQVLQYFFK